MNTKPAEILIISSYPSRECGIASYTQDLIASLKTKFNKSFKISVCALENKFEKHIYPQEVKFILDTSDESSYEELGQSINNSGIYSLIMIQHEFGFFNTREEALIKLINLIKIPTLITFHTVLPNPHSTLLFHVRNMVSSAQTVTVMTKNAALILQNDYGVSPQKITVIKHGTHLVPHLDKEVLKEKYGIGGRKIVTTFGLLSSGKGIETTLKALPEIIKDNHDILFLILGKTHPCVVKSDGEIYRQMLESLVEELNIYNHVKFINRYIKLPELLEYLQLTDVYLFTSQDPYQAVSGTFSYAISCGCPVISTPIPHACEELQNNAGIIIDFANIQQLSMAVKKLLNDENLRKNITSNGLHTMASTVWENVAIAHAKLFKKTNLDIYKLHYSIPDIHLNHIKKLTTDFGMIQFSKMNHPDLNSGYTLDDNARALIALCMSYEQSPGNDNLDYIIKYLNFIYHCQQADGAFLNYIDAKQNFTEQNNGANLADANGRAIWALGFLISKKSILPESVVDIAAEMLSKTLPHIKLIYSTRAMAFAIKGLYFSNLNLKDTKISMLISLLADRMVQMYRHESENNWDWYESYLTYANSVLPESMLYAWLQTGNITYKDIAKTTFDFLLSHTFNENGMKVISNRSWLIRGENTANHGEQPIDVTYTIMALSLFYNVFKTKNYSDKLLTAFNWFLGKNHLQQIIYNPCTGGCYDGLEENNVNLNQGAESTISYLMARLTMEKFVSRTPKVKPKISPIWSTANLNMSFQSL